MNCLFVLLFFCTSTVFTTNIDVKTYKGYKVYEVIGGKDDLDSILESVKELEELQIPFACPAATVKTTRSFARRHSTTRHSTLRHLKSHTIFSGRNAVGMCDLYECLESQKQFHNQSQDSEQFVIERNTATSLQTVVPPGLVSSFEKIVAKQKLRPKVISEDASKTIRLEKAAALQKKEFSWSAYYDIDDIYGYLENMSKSYPQRTELVVAGMSYEGRQILGLRINTPEGRAEDKPAVFIESGIHAREWITPATTTYFINQLLTSNNSDIVALRNQFDWYIFPSVNPDGYHFSYTKDRYWRGTRSKSENGCYGADPNRNWNYTWLKHSATNDSCDSEAYGGSEPFSEIETRMLSEYIQKIKNLLGYIAFHAYSQMLLVPYSDSEEHKDNYNDLKKIGKTSLDYGYKVNGAKYDGPATAAEILYKSSGTSTDWVKYTLRTKLVYTYELRGDGFHWPPTLIDKQGDEVTQMMLGLFKEAKNLKYYN